MMVGVYNKRNVEEEHVCFSWVLNGTTLTVAWQEHYHICHLKAALLLRIFA